MICPVFSPWAPMEIFLYNCEWKKGIFECFWGFLDTCSKTPELQDSPPIRRETYASQKIDSILSQVWLIMSTLSLRFHWVVPYWILECIIGMGILGHGQISAPPTPATTHTIKFCALYLQVATLWPLLLSRGLHTSGVFCSLKDGTSVEPIRAPKGVIWEENSVFPAT